MSPIYSVYKQNVDRYSNKIAIYSDGKAMSYKQFDEIVEKWSFAFAQMGVKKGDAIGVLLPNNIEFVALIFVASRIGCVLVPLNCALPIDAIQTAFKAADVIHIVSLSNILLSIKESTSDFSFIWGVWLTIDSGLDKTFQTLSAILQSNTDNITTAYSGDATDPLILTMTSGSTGNPKPIILTQQTKFNRAMAAIELYAVSNSDTILAATPLYHSLAERLVIIPFLIGATSILMPRYSTSEWIKYVAEQKVTFTIAVSSQLRMINQSLNDNETATKITSLRCVVSSSERIDEETKNDLIAKLKCDFHECYGASEIAIATNLNANTDKTKITSVGKPAPGVDVIILKENNEVAKPTEIGEIACKTSMIFGGYYKRPDLTQQAMRGEYFKTGDLGKLDEDGYLYFMGRSKDLIISGGINVYPRDIEAIFMQEPEVIECAAFALSDINLGEVVGVALVLSDQEKFDRRKYRRLSAEKLADFQQPREYFLLNELPKNSVGKVMKNKIQEFL